MIIASTRCESDYCVFVKKNPLIVLTVYVDDLVLMTETSLQTQQLKSELIKEFKMINMAPLQSWCSSQTN